MVSDQIERFISSEAYGDNEMSIPRGIGMCCEGRRRSIASIWDVGSAATDAKAAEVACMRLGGKKGRIKDP